MALGITVDMNLGTAGFSSGVNHAVNDAQRLEREVGGATSKIKEHLGALAGVVSIGASWAFIKSGIDELDGLADAADRSGIAVERLAGLKWSAHLGDTGLEAVIAGANKLSIALGKDAEQFKALGIVSKDPYEALKQFADVFAGVNDEQTRAALGMSVLGKSYAELAPLLKNGAAGIEEMTQAGMQMTGVTRESVEMAGQFNDQLDQLSFRAEKVAIPLASKLLTALNGVTGAIAAANAEAGKFTGSGFLSTLEGVANWMSDVGEPLRNIDKINAQIVSLEENIASLKNAGVGGKLLNTLVFGDSLAAMENDLRMFKAARNAEYEKINAAREQAQKAQAEALAPAPVDDMDAKARKFIDGADKEAKAADRLTHALEGVHRAKIQAAAVKHGVDPNYLMTIAAIESDSGLNTGDGSNGAHGVMQIRRAAALDIAKQTGWAVEQIFNDVDKNIEGSAIYAKMQLEQLRKTGDATSRNAALAYNQGVGGARGAGFDPVKTPVPKEAVNYLKQFDEIYSGFNKLSGKAGEIDEQYKTWEEQQKKTLEEGRALTESLLTPSEKYAKNIEKINALRGTIGEEKYAQAMQKERQALIQSQLSTDEYKETLAAVDAQVDELLKSEKALSDLQTGAATTKRLADLAAELKLQGLTNEQIAQRIELERQVIATQGQNAGIDPKKIRDAVTAAQSEQERLNQIMAAGANEFETAYQRAIENTQDALAGLFESMINGAAFEDGAVGFLKQIQSFAAKEVANSLSKDITGLFFDKNAGFTGGNQLGANGIAGQIGGLLGFGSGSIGKKIDNFGATDTGRIASAGEIAKGGGGSNALSGITAAIGYGQMGSSIGGQIGGLIAPDVKQNDMVNLAGQAVGAGIGAIFGSPQVGAALGGLLSSLAQSFMYSPPTATAAYYTSARNTQTYVKGSASASGGGDVEAAKRAAQEMGDPRFFANLEGQIGVDFGGFMARFTQEGKDMSIAFSNAFGTFVDAAVTEGDKASYEAAMRQAGAKLIKQSVAQFADEAEREVVRSKANRGLKKMLEQLTDVREIRILTGRSGELSRALLDLDSKFKVLETSAQKYGLSLDELDAAYNRQVTLIKYQAETGLRSMAGIGESVDSLFYAFQSNLIKARGDWYSAGLDLAKMGDLTTQAVGQFKASMLLPFTDLRAAIVDQLERPMDLAGLNDAIAQGLAGLNAANDPTAELAKIQTIQDAAQKRYNLELQNIDKLARGYENLKAFTDSLKLGEFSYLSPLEKLKEAENQYLAEKTKAISTGDYSALVQAEQTYLSEAKAFWGETNPFFDIVRLIEESNNALGLNLKAAVGTAESAKAELDGVFTQLLPVVDKLIIGIGAAVDKLTGNIELPALGVSAESDLSQAENFRGVWNSEFDESAKALIDARNSGASKTTINRLKGEKSDNLEKFKQADLLVKIEKSEISGNDKQTANLYKQYEKKYGDMPLASPSGSESNKSLEGMVAALVEENRKMAAKLEESLKMAGAANEKSIKALESIDKGVGNMSQKMAVRK